MGDQERSRTPEPPVAGTLELLTTALTVGLSKWAQAA
jgi:hypothetical protein